MLTLQAVKVQGQTYLYLDNTLKAIIPRSVRKDRKEIVINCFKYKLEFYIS